MGWDTLQELYNSAPEIDLEAQGPLVVISDLHMGNGGRNDDFLKNAQLIQDALENYYFPKHYTLVLNGDIEELLRTDQSSIEKAWPDMYRIFKKFYEAKRLIWLRGNHEIVPRKEIKNPYYFPADAVRFTLQDKTLFIFHGHQAGKANSGKYNTLIALALKIFANNLRIGNRSVSHSSEKKFKIEKCVYEFSRNKGIVSIIGHTHRPLFESLSKDESLGYQIERMCREYSRSNNGRRLSIQKTILQIKAEYLRKPKRKGHRLADTVYGQILTPCLFNAGCGIGKTGITALEIKNKRLSLVFWSCKHRTKKFMEFNEYKPATLLGDSAYRFILRREELDYVFSRIELLK